MSHENFAQVPDAPLPTEAVLECYAERAALTLRRAANFTQCLVNQRLAPQITLLSPQGVPFLLHGKDLCHEGTWRKFLQATPLAEPLLCQLVEGSAELTRRYRSWLLTAYTRRYRALAEHEHLRWFRSVTRLAVLWHMMEAKARHSAFADAWVAQEMEVLITLELLSTQIAKAIHHIVKEPKELAPQLIERLYQTHAADCRTVCRAHSQSHPDPTGAEPPAPAFLCEPLRAGDQPAGAD